MELECRPDIAHSVSDVRVWSREDDGLIGYEVPSCILARGKTASIEVGAHRPQWIEGKIVDGRFDSAPDGMEVSFVRKRPEVRAVATVCVSNSSGSCTWQRPMDMYVSYSCSPRPHYCYPIP